MEKWQLVFWHILLRVSVHLSLNGTDHPSFTDVYIKANDLCMTRVR